MGARLLKAPDRRRLLTSLLLVLALGAGAWKILALAKANRALDSQNRDYASAAAAFEASLRAVRERSLRRGAKVPGFTLLGLGAAGADPRLIRLDPASEKRPMHLLFVDPTRPDSRRLLESYAATFGRTEPDARILLLTPAGFEVTAGGLAGRRLPHPVAVDAAEIYRAYGFVDGPGIAIVEGGTLREKWRLPRRGDELPLE